MNENIATYQGRLVLTLDQQAFLAGYADHYNHVERILYADMQRTGRKAAYFKKEYLVRFGITARQFNAIARNLEGKIASVLKLLLLQKQDLKRRIGKALKVISKIKDEETRHQKKRRLNNLETRLLAVERQITDKEPRICFGSRTLFRRQFNLEANGYADHEEWKQDWVAKRNSQFYVLGSRDETAGCQGCTISANLDGTFNLRLRSMSKKAEYVLFENVSIPYGQDIIRAAMRSRQSISYRFLRDKKGWRVFITTDMPKIGKVSVKALGAIGIDINGGCLAVSETDRFGNLIGSLVIPLVTYGKDSNQARAIIGEAVKEVVSIAKKAMKPVVIEKLDFSKKKAALENEDPKQARMISSLSLQQDNPGHQVAGLPVRHRSHGSRSGVYNNDRRGELRQPIWDFHASGSGVRHCPAWFGFLRKARQAAGCPGSQRRPWHFFCACKDAWETCMVAMGGYSEETQSGACSTRPVGNQ